LPEDVSFGEGESSPLASSKELKERVERLFGKGWTPEYDTLDTFVDSSWYFLRYLDPKDEHNFSDLELMKKWMPVERYSGGSEHTTMHLLYARFFTKALYDLALCPVSEPFTERYNRGLILGTDGAKMSKSKGNVVNPDEFVGKYGADAVRSYLAFIGPYNEPGHYPWNLDGVDSMRRFLDRIFRLKEALVDEEPDEALLRKVAKANAKVASDIERFKFNTALSALMVLLNLLEELPKTPRKIYREFLQLLSPFAPHLAEELWADTSGEGILAATPWPSAPSEFLQEETVTVVVQVRGKRKGEIVLSPDAPKEEAEAAALMLPALSGVEPGKVIYVPGRIINIVPEEGA
jgi:leucyl-tRNA synthetase